MKRSMEDSMDKNGENGSSEEFEETADGKVKKIKNAIIPDKNALIKPTSNGIAIIVNYDFIKRHIPRYKDYSNEQMRGILSKCTQDELHEVFAAGIRAYVEEKIIVSLERAEERYIEEQEALKKAQESDDKKDRRWLFIPLVIVLGASAFTMYQCTYNPNPNPIESQGPEEDPSKKEETEDEDLADTVTQVVTDTFTIYSPDSSTQFEKAVTDYGNQENASTDRKNSTISDGQEEWDKEGQALEDYDENYKNIEKLKELIEILKSDTATLEEKKEALRKMLDPAIDVSENFDSEQMDEMVQNAIEKSQESPDEKTEKEVQLALEMQQSYEEQKRCQESNVRVLMYLQYLEENGYDIGDVEVKVDERGTLTIAITSSRIVDKDVQDIGSKSFKEYSNALDEYLGANQDHDIRKFNNYLRGEEKITSESPKVNSAEKSGFSIEDYEAMLENRDPERVLKATDKLIAAMKSGKYYTIVNMDSDEMRLYITPPNTSDSYADPTNEEGDESR
jgi:hypothetical protein